MAWEGIPLCLGLIDKEDGMIDIKREPSVNFGIRLLAYTF